MRFREQLAEVIDQMITNEQIDSNIEPSIVDEYKKLDENCNKVLDKIKNRKGKKNKKQTG